MKKIIITEDQYNKLDKFINEQVNDNRYYMDVKVDISYTGKIKDYVDEITSSSIRINYLIEAEYRHWGIKDISLYDIKGPEEIELDISYYTSLDSDFPETETKTVKVPLNWDTVETEEDKDSGTISVGSEIIIYVTENEKDELYCTHIIVPVNTL